MHHVHFIPILLGTNRKMQQKNLAFIDCRDGKTMEFELWIVLTSVTIFDIQFWYCLWNVCGESLTTICWKLRSKLSVSSPEISTVLNSIHRHQCLTLQCNARNYLYFETIECCCRSVLTWQLVDGIHLFIFDSRWLFQLIRFNLEQKYSFRFEHFDASAIRNQNHRCFNLCMVLNICWLNRILPSKPFVTREQ